MMSADYQFCQLGSGLRMRDHFEIALPVWPTQYNNQAVGGLVGAVYLRHYRSPKFAVPVNLSS